ncbi:MAG TPA: hypothetical protein VL981_05045 [Candidatus Methylacidiphilales bacterium]|nr:hypothetical protein [Candidatus Methylacidiphilales bacterium]
MRFFPLAVTFALAAALCRADDSPPELKVIEARYSPAHFAQNESLRQKYITELAILRWRLARQDKPGWEAVDAEIERYPAPANLDEKALAQKRIGWWHSPRHDYLFRANGTWVMDDPNDPEATHGTWSIRGNHYTESAAGETKPRPYTIILFDAENFIFADADPGLAYQSLYYEKRSLHGGLPLRRDDPAP